MQGRRGARPSTDSVLGLLEDPQRERGLGPARSRRRSRPVRQDRQLHRPHLQGGRRRLQDHHRPGRPAQQPAIPDADPPGRGLPRLRDQPDPGGPASRSASARSTAIRRSGRTAQPTARRTGTSTRASPRNLGITPEQRPWLFVVKKNKTVLERLLDWIRNHVADTHDPQTGQTDRHQPAAAADRRRGRSRVRRHRRAGLRRRRHARRGARADGHQQPHPQDPALASRGRPMSATRRRRSPTSSSTSEARRSEEGPDLFPSVLHHQPRGRRPTTSARPGCSACARRMGASAGCRWSARSPTTSTEDGRAAGCRRSTRTTMSRCYEGRTSCRRRSRGDRCLRPRLRGAAAAGPGERALLDARPRHPVQLRAEGRASRRSRSIVQRICASGSPAGSATRTFSTQLQRLWESDFVPTTDAAVASSIRPERACRRSTWEEIADGPARRCRRHRGPDDQRHGQGRARLRRAARTRA